MRLLIMLCCVPLLVQAQIPKVNLGTGQWRSLPSFSSSNCVAAGNGRVYSGRYALLEYIKEYNAYNYYTKVNGLSSSNISLLSYNNAQQTLVICYADANIDLFQNGSFTNLPDLKIAQVPGSKQINSAIQVSNLCIIGSDMGLLYIDLVKQEIKTSFPIVLNGTQAQVKQVYLHNDSIFAVTTRGILSISAQESFPQEISRWRVLTTDAYEHLAIINTDVYAAQANKLYKLSDWTTASLFFESDKTITDLKTKNSELYVVSFEEALGAQINVFNSSGTEINKITGLGARQITLEDNDDRIWCADVYQGLKAVQEPNNSQFVFTIDGPKGNSAHQLRFIDGKLFVACGDVNVSYNPIGNRDGFNVYDTKNNSWRNYSASSGYKLMDSCLDILDIAYDVKNKKIYAPAYNQGGLLEFDEQNNPKLYKYNTGLDPASIGDPTRFSCSHVALDKRGTLWMSTGFTNTNLVALSNGQFYRFKLPVNGSTLVVGNVTIDNIGQKWISLPRGQGLVVYNDNGTLETTTDDKARVFTSGAGSGNLASNNVLCTALDNDGKLWVGTDNGISIINCAESALSSSNCEAENRIVQYDLKADKLFIGEAVRAIAVDGGNRKWIGTTNGLWLISADAQEIIHQFNTNNSPLPTNEITSIAIDGADGSVYVGTRSGIVAYKADATTGATNDDIEPFVFPNPVTANSGVITIKNLVANADVRIVDAAGQLVYRTKANGGTATWSGLTYTGQRPHSGVYYVLAATSDGTLRQKTSFTFLH